MTKPTKRQIQLLEVLSKLFHLRMSQFPKNCVNENELWFTPMELGGSDKSHHSRTLKQLRRIGFVKMRPRAGLGGSLEYTITPSGDATVKLLNE